MRVVLLAGTLLAIAGSLFFGDRAAPLVPEVARALTYQLAPACGKPGATACRAATRVKTLNVAEVRLGRGAEMLGVVTLVSGGTEYDARFLPPPPAVIGQVYDAETYGGVLARIHVGGSWYAPERSPAQYDYRPAAALGFLSLGCLGIAFLLVRFLREGER